MEELQPRKGAIAYCSVGRLGLILNDSPEEFEFFNGDKAVVWKGIQLTKGLGGKNKDYPQEVGDFWCSTKPKVIGYIEDVISFIEEYCNNKHNNRNNLEIVVE